MSVSTFEESLQGVADSCRRVAPGEAGDVLTDLIDAPVVGVPLPFEGVDLPDAVVTDFTVSDLREARTGVTPAGLGVATYGTVTVRSTAKGEELAGLYPPRHVVVLHAEDIVPDMAAAFERLSEEFTAGTDTQVLATGPSATADMGTLVQGVHGPQGVHVVVIES